MLKNLKVGARLTAGFVIMIALMAVIAVISVGRLQALNGSVHVLVQDRFPKTLQVSDAIEQVNIIARALRNMILWDNPAEAAKEEDRIKAARAATGEIIAKLEISVKSADGKRLLDAMKEARAKYLPAQDSIIALINQGLKTEATGILLSSYRALQTEYLAAWGKLREYQVMLSNKAGEDSEAITNNALRSILILGIASGIFAILLALLITNSIVKPLAKCITAAESIAKGNTAVDLSVEGKDELSALQRAMKSMTDALEALIADAGMLSQAAVDGKLATRADATKHLGDYRKIVEGVNNTLDSVIGPLNVTARYVDDISKGVIPPIITDSYNGDFNIIKANLNAVVKMMSDLLSETDKLVKAAIAGQLDTRADASKFLGGWNQLVKGINDTLAEVITPVNETVAVLKRLADGDLTLRMTGDYKGDFDILKTALNDSLESFNDILGQVNIAVDQVAEGALQVSQASQSLSQGATEQASSLEEITSSVTEIASQTKLNTESAGQVNSLAKTAKGNAENGNTQMQNLVVAMGDINKSAEDIKKIVKAIDDISFQINLLALNANVEAARAGKYGKGFAVVAEEVRNLAVRSANSVKDTTRMVDDTIANIERGNALCDLTAKQLSDIVGGAGQVATLAEEVATASREQTQGLEQVSTGLNQIDQVTQANTASSEESASASEELSSQSQQVKAMLSRFKLKAKEGKLSNAEMMQMLRQEMAKQGSAYRPGSAGAGPKSLPGPVRKTKATAINPADVISLDDDNFGKF
jgi:methyl-accepting chemotaxis protein